MSPKPKLIDETKAHAMVAIVDGAQQEFTKPAILRVRNNREIDFTQSTDKPFAYVGVDFHDGPGDDYTVIVSADGYRDAGFLFHPNPAAVTQISLLMIPKNHRFAFPSWENLRAENLAVAAFVSIGGDDASAKANYLQLQSSNPAALACLLNIAQAVCDISLGGVSPVPYFKELIWDATMAQDRFFAFVDPALIPLVKAAADRNEFAEEVNCGQFHQGATHSWKQKAFDVANVQLTFHENDKKVIGGVECVKIEPDIDLYKDLITHGLGEVIPNKVQRGLTDPSVVYAMRWAVAKDAKGPVFDPGYQIV